MQFMTFLNCLCIYFFISVCCLFLSVGIGRKPKMRSVRVRGITCIGTGLDSSASTRSSHSIWSSEDTADTLYEYMTSKKECNNQIWSRQSYAL